MSDELLMNAILRTEELGIPMDDNNERERLRHNIIRSEQKLRADIGADSIDGTIVLYLIDRAIGAYLSERRLRAPESIPLLPDSPDEKRISLGDMTVEYRDRTEKEEQFTAMLESLHRSGELEIAAIRRLVW